MRHMEFRRSVQSGAAASIWEQIKNVWHKSRPASVSHSFTKTLYNLIEFVGAGVLPELGVPPDVANATAFGAYINSDSFRALGAEIEIEADQATALRIGGKPLTGVDATPGTRSFTGSAIQPVINPAFPNIPIGAFSPLVGARPLDRAPHSNRLALNYA